MISLNIQVLSKINIGCTKSRDVYMGIYVTPGGQPFLSVELGVNDSSLAALFHCLDPPRVRRRHC
jgi:hypothetical protein